jgi:hypothetical protein
MSTTNAVSTAFGELLAAIYRNLTTGFWFVLLEHKDWPTTEQNPDVEYVITLQQHTGLDCDTYTNMLQMLGLTRVDTRNGGWQIKKKPWENFFRKHLNGGDCNDFEIDRRDPFGKMLWLVKLKVSSGGYNNLKEQIKAQSTLSLANLRYLRNNLQRAIQNSIAANMISEPIVAATEPSTELNRNENEQSSTEQSDDEPMPSVQDNEESEMPTPHAENEMPTPHAENPDVQPTEETNRLFSQIDVTKFSSVQLEVLQHKLAKEQMRRSKTSCSFQLSSHNDHQYAAIPVPKMHSSNKAFLAHQRKKPYVREFCSAVGGGDLELGVERVMSYLAPRYDDLYLKCGKDCGLALPQTMDADGLAAMACDCNLKQWQLLKVLKYIRYATGCKVTSVTVKNMEAEFAKDMVVPETGTYRYTSTNDKGTTTTEIIEYDYQSITEVYQYIVAQKLMELDVDLNSIERIVISLGGDHGIGAFRLNLTILIVVRVGDGIEVIRDDIGVSTIHCKKDTSDIIKNTILGLLKEDLATFNNSRTILHEDADGFISCKLQPKSDPVRPDDVEVVTIKVYCIGDLKWLAMLLGMENYSGDWCIHCILKQAQWQACDHDKGEKRTLKSINDTVDKYNITDSTKTTTKHKGVMGRPLLGDLVPLLHFIIPLLHKWMGIFNDIDAWFMKRVDKVVTKTEGEKSFVYCISALDTKCEEIQ